MVTTDAVEGTVDERFRFHYDLFGDVLYIRLLNEEGIVTFGELTDEGDILLREEATSRPVGITVVSWWKRFGNGTTPDSISEITRNIEPVVRHLAA